MSNLKVPTRQEYYASQGFSGSAIDRPDDPIDDAFVQHCEGLKAFANGFIDYCKAGNNSMPYTGVLENQTIEVNSSEVINSVIASLDTMIKESRELSTLYAKLYEANKADNKHNSNICPDIDFTAKTLDMLDNFAGLTSILLASIKTLEAKINLITEVVQQEKLQRDYELLMYNLQKILNLEK